MARRPLRQLVREARDAEKGRRGRPGDFAEWLSAGIEALPDDRTKDATFHFDNGTLSIEFEYPSSAELSPSLDRRADYNRLLAEMALRCVHHALSTDQNGAIRSIVFDGSLDTIDLSTGRDIHPVLVHFDVSREVFDQLDLARVDPVACLHGLEATLAMEESTSNNWAI